MMSLFRNLFGCSRRQKIVDQSIAEHVSSARRSREETKETIRRANAKLSECERLVMALAKDANK